MKAEADFELMGLYPREINGKKSIHYNGMLIASYNKSQTLDTWWVYGKNISDSIAECKDENECMLAAKAMFIDWLTGVKH